MVRNYLQNPILWGSVLTFLVIGATVWLGMIDVCVNDFNGSMKCMGRWKLLLSSPANEIGDAVAGIAGALAFVWIIVTVALQGRELVAQRQELELARLQHTRTADALSEQIVVLMDEQRQRLEKRAEEYLDALLRNLLNSLKIISNIEWRFESASRNIDRLHFCQSISIGDRSDDDILCAVNLIMKNTVRAKNSIKRIKNPSKPPSRNQNFMEVGRILRSISDMRGELSNSQKERLMGLKFDDLWDSYHFFDKEMEWSGGE